MIEHWQSAAYCGGDGLYATEKLISSRPYWPFVVVPTVISVYLLLIPPRPKKGDPV
jgi:hypothetical protein